MREAAYRVAEWKLRVHDESEMTLTHNCARARLSATRYAMKWFVVNERVKMAIVPRRYQADKEGSGTRHATQPASKVDREHCSKPPSVADLRETGQFENDAHAIVLIHRGWDDATSKIDLDGEFVMHKLRNEKTGAIPNNFNSTVLQFE